MAKERSIFATSILLDYPGRLVSSAVADASRRLECANSRCRQSTSLQRDRMFQQVGNQHPFHRADRPVLLRQLRIGTGQGRQDRQFSRSLLDLERNLPLAETAPPTPPSARPACHPGQLSGKMLAVAGQSAAGALAGAAQSSRDRNSCHKAPRPSPRNSHPRYVDQPSSAGTGDWDDRVRSSPPPARSTYP